MDLNLAQSLGLMPIESNPIKKKELFFDCWANSHSVGTQRGVRDATPGILRVMPNSSVDIEKPLTKKVIGDIIHNSSRRVVFPFSVINGAKPRASWQVPGDMGIILDSLDPVEWFTTVSDTKLNSFEDLVFEQIMEQVYSDGPVSVTVDKTKRMVASLISLTKHLNKAFKYTNILYAKSLKQSSRDSVKYGKPEFRCSFLKPSQCVPFFGTNSGGIIHITATQSKYSKANGKFVPLFEFIGLFTDNVGAVQNVDGGINFFGRPKPFSGMSKILNEAHNTFEHMGAKTTGSK